MITFPIWSVSFICVNWFISDLPLLVDLSILRSLLALWSGYLCPEYIDMYLFGYHHVNHDYHFDHLYFVGLVIFLF